MVQDGMMLSDPSDYALGVWGMRWREGKEDQADVISVIHRKMADEHGWKVTSFMFSAERGKGHQEKDLPRVDEAELLSNIQENWPEQAKQVARNMLGITEEPDRHDFLLIQGDGERVLELYKQGKFPYFMEAEISDDGFYLGISTPEPRNGGPLTKEAEDALTKSLSDLMMDMQTEEMLGRLRNQPEMLEQSKPYVLAFLARPCPNSGECRCGPVRSALRALYNVEEGKDGE